MRYLLFVLAIIALLLGPRSFQGQDQQSAQLEMRLGEIAIQIQAIESAILNIELEKATESAPSISDPEGISRAEQLEARESRYIWQLYQLRWEGEAIQRSLQ